jgi:heptosyltransferase-2
VNPPSERILVRGVNWLGDAVMTTPALMRLREVNPVAHITLLTHEKLADLWTNHPSANAVLTFGSRDGIWSVAQKLRAGRFNLGLVLPNSPRSALELWLAGIPRRIGYARPWRNWLLTQRIQPPTDVAEMRKRPVDEIKRLVAANPGEDSRGSPHRPQPRAAHHCHLYLQLVSALGANPEPLPPRLEVGAEELAAAKQRFSLAATVPWFGLNPHAEYGPAKRWPPERFLAAAADAQKRTNCRWLILGGPADVALATEMANALGNLFPSAPPLNLAGRTTLRELCAVLKLCQVLLTNDTGPMHVAAALGTPVVAIFGSTSPEMTGPGLPGGSPHYLLKSHAACAPCFRRACPIDLRCMTGISVECVVDAVARAFAAASQRPM